MLERVRFGSFNPTLVRLRPTSVLGRAPPHRRFNPTLVRLRLEWLVRAGDLSQLLFQSHAGSIEAIAILLSAQALPAVSIPRWFD